MIENVRHASMYVKSDGSKHYYTSHIYRRRSQDNGKTWADEEEVYRSDPGNTESVQKTSLATILHPKDVLIHLYMTFEIDFDEGPFTRGNRI